MEEGGRLPLNIAPAQTTHRIGEGSRDRHTKTGATLPWHPQATASACLEATEGGTSARTGHCVVNNDTRWASKKGGAGPLIGWRPGGGRPASQHGRRTGRPRGSEAPSTSRGGGVEDPPLLQHNRDMGAAPSTEEGADLQVFTPARDHL